MGKGEEALEKVKAKFSKLKEDMKGLDTRAAEGLADAIIKVGDEDGEINLNKIARAAMKDKGRYYLRIGKKALEGEKKVLNTMSGKHIEIISEGSLDAGIEGSNFGKLVENIKQAGKNIKTLGKNIKHKVKKDGEKEEYEEYEHLTSPKKAIESLKSEFGVGTIISLGAGGLRGILDPTNFQWYEVEYPVFKINEGGKEELLEKLIHCKWVPNSMFCAAGSAKIYKQALKTLQGK